MKTTIIFVFVALLAGIAAARPDRRFVLKAREVNVQMARSPADAVQFLKGFAVGLETVLGDPAACAKDITNMTADFNAAFQHISEGIKHVSIASVKRGLLEFADGLQKASAAFRDCGVEKAAEDIAQIVAEIKSGRVLQFIEHEVVHIWHHGRELVHLFKDMVAEWKSKQFYECGIDVGEIVAIILEGKNVPQQDVKPVDLALFVKGVAEGMGQQLTNTTACVTDADIAIADFNAAWADIVYGIKHISVKTIKRALQEFADGIQHVADAFTACGLEKAAEIIKKLVKEIREGKIIEVIAREAIHILFKSKELVHLFKSASENWRGNRFESSGKDTGKILAILLQLPQ